MFNALQEGIIVVEDNSNITFMNELSNRVFSEIANVRDFFKSKTHSD
jgi:sensor histidine kinase regulating citrate/malate metabolism